MPEHWSLCFTKNVFCYSDHSPHGITAPSGPGPPHYRGFTITLRHTTLGRIPLDEWSARRRDLYLYNTQHSQQTNIHAPGGIRTHNLSRRVSQTARLLGPAIVQRLSCLSMNYCSSCEVIWISVTAVTNRCHSKDNGLPNSRQELA